MCGITARVYTMGSGSAMLVAVRAPEGKAGPLTVTNIATEARLHYWGVTREGKGDLMTAALTKIWPPKSALGSPFLPCSVLGPQQGTVCAA